MSLLQSYSGLRGAVAFSLALSRINAERVLMTSTDPVIVTEFNLRKSMLTAVTFLVLFTVFVQVSGCGLVEGCGLVAKVGRCVCSYRWVWFGGGVWLGGQGR